VSERMIIVHLESALIKRIPLRIET